MLAIFFLGAMVFLAMVFGGLIAQALATMNGWGFAVFCICVWLYLRSKRPYVYRLKRK